MYTFKPFVFMKHEAQSVERPKARSGHRIVCNHKNLYSYGGFNPCIADNDPDMRNDEIWSASKPLFKEVWKFNLVTQQWKRLPGQDNMPNELASNAVILRGNSLMVYGGTGVPFGQSCSNHLYVCNVDDGKMYTVPAKGELPEPHYGQALICHGSYLYTVGGTTGYEYSCDIHRFDLRTGVWEPVYICSGRDQSEPTGRYRHELAFDGKLIYVLGGGTAAEAFGFSEIPAFNLVTNKWIVLNTYGDSDDNTVPEPRRCHGSVQYTDEKTGITSVVISGGYNGDHVFSDVWRLDLSLLQWTCLRKCILPCPVYFHSAALTPEGRMYTFGGIVRENNELDRTDAVHSVWLTIPKLSEMCWQAVIYYNPDIRHKTRDELLYMGIPLKFVQRIDWVSGRRKLISNMKRNMNKEYYNSFRSQGPSRENNRFESRRFDSGPNRFDGRDEQEFAPHRTQRPSSSRPKPKATTRPPKVEGEKVSGLPKPQHLSTTATAPKNDPLYREAVMPEPGREARPIPREVVVYPGFHAIDQIAWQIHRSISAVDNGFNRRVPESAMAYFAATLSYARLLKVLDVPGRPITNDEDIFMRMIYARDYSVPALLGYFMDGLGNTNLNQREVRMRAKPREYVRSEEDQSIGWFGKVSADTHYLYAAYPCLAVYATRIASDLLTLMQAMPTRIYSDTGNQ